MTKTEIILNFTTVITGILALFIAWRVFIVGNKQFEKNLELSQDQLNLSKTERIELQKASRPILVINTGGFLPIKNDNGIKISYITKLQNSGIRPATDIHIKLIALALNKSDNTITILDTFDEKAANSIPQNVTWDVGRDFLWNNYIGTQIILVLKLEYSDKIIDETFFDDYYFTIPQYDELKMNLEDRLINTNIIDKELIEKYINENL